MEPIAAAAIGGPLAEILLYPHRQEFLRITRPEPTRRVAGMQLNQREYTDLRPPIILPRIEEPILGAQLRVAKSRTSRSATRGIECVRRDDMQLKFGSRAVIDLHSR